MEQPAHLVTESTPAAARTPFHFYTSLILQESTGLRAATLPTLLKLLRTVPVASVYYHTHYFLVQHHYLTPGPANDFAYWVTEVLGDKPLGERLASIDTTDYSSLEHLREVLVRTIDAYLQSQPLARFKFVPAGEEFFFLKSVHIILSTPYSASTLLEFAQALEHVSLHSLYFHLFDARLRLGRTTNDFSKWIAEQLGLKDLAEQISQLDLYAHTLETLRTNLLAMIRQQLNLL